MRARALARELESQLARSGVPEPRFEAELLVRSATGFSRADFFTDPDILPSAELQARRLSERRARREPAAYLTGEKEFFGLPLKAGPRALIPRPETELLVELALAECSELTRPTVIDVGTGSGAVAIAVALGLGAGGGGRVIATDVEASALALARENASRHQARVQFLLGDLLTSVRSADVIVANLPYIETATIPSLEPEVREWEPRSALDGGHDGMRVLDRLISDCGARIRPRVLALEVGRGMAPGVAALAGTAGATVEILEDLAAVQRVVVGRWA